MLYYIKYLEEKAVRRKVLQHVTPGKVFIRSEIYSELCGVFPEIAVCI